MASSEEAPTAQSSTLGSTEALANNEDSTAKGSSISEVDKSQESKEEPNDQSVQGNENCSDENCGNSSSAEGDREKTLEYAAELMEKGSKAIEDGDYVDAVDSLSRAVEIRVAHYGELAPECATAYYKYGCALLYKAQEEADPLGSMPKKESTSANSEGSADPVVIDAKQGSTSTGKDGEVDEGPSEKEHADDDGSEDDEAEPEGDEDESDLDLAWKLLDVARAIVEKQSQDTIEKVNILAALGEVSLEREDIETSLADYLKALSILESLAEPDNRRLAELNFRVCLVLELSSRVEEAIPYCQKAILVCKARLQRLRAEVENQEADSTAMTVNADSEFDSNKKDMLPVVEVHSDLSILEKEKEIETLTGLASELEKKLEDLEQVIQNPKSMLSEVLKMVGAKPEQNEKTDSEKLNSSEIGIMSGGFDSPTGSTAATNGSFTHLGVIGRGVKRATLTPNSGEPSSKKPAANSSGEKADSTASGGLDSSTPGTPSKDQ